MTAAYMIFALLFLGGLWVIESFGDTEIGPRAQSNTADMIGASFSAVGLIGFVVTGVIHLWSRYA